MLKTCAFEELPQKLKERINSLGPSLPNGPKVEVVQCSDSERESECIVRDGPVFGIYSYNKVIDLIGCHWIGKFTIEFLYNAIQESTRP